MSADPYLRALSPTARYCKSAGVTGVTTTRARVLVVEDSLFTRTVLTGALLAAGYEVQSAGSLQEALEMASANPPDVAVLDVFLDEGPSGLDVARALRGRHGASPTYIIAFSGHFASDAVRLARDAGCDRFLVKPCPSELLIETIEQFLRARTPADGTAALSDDLDHAS